jgi:hypothetical protein
MRDAVTRFQSAHVDRHPALIALRALWIVIRLPVLALLVILEPVVRVLLSGLALLITLTAFFWLAVRGLAAFPFWTMLGLGIGALVLLTLYYALMRLFSL